MSTNTVAAGWIDAAGPYELSIDGDPTSLVNACAEAAANATVSKPYIIRLKACTVTLTAPLTLPSYTTLVGAGREATVIQRTTSTTNTGFPAAIPNTYCDPVVECTSKTNVSIASLTLLHTGTSDTSQGAGLKNPCGLMSGDAHNLRLNNVRLEGNWAGWFDKSDSVEGGSTNVSKPIPADRIGDENYQYHIDNSIVIGHSVAGAAQIARREVFATGCKFIVHVRSTDAQQTNTAISGFNHWEFTVGHYKSCHFIARAAQTLTISSTTEMHAAFAIRDSGVSDTIAFCDDCTFYLDLGDGDVNSTNTGAASVYVNGGTASGGTLTQFDGNILEAESCRFHYETGTITSAPFITGLYIDQTVGVNTIGQARLRACNFYDVTGSGGTLRTDIVVAGHLANVQPKLVSVDGCNVLDWSYKAISGSPVWTHSAFGKQTNNINFQQSTAAFSSAQTVAVTLPVQYSASAGVTDYNVTVEPNGSEIFWVSSKTNTGFTLNSSNAASTSTVRYVVTR